MTRFASAATVVALLSMAPISAEAASPTRVTLGNVSLPTSSLRSVLDGELAARADVAAGYRLDIVVDRIQSDSSIRFEARVLILDAKTKNLRHAVHARANAKRSAHAAKNARMETTVAQAAMRRAVRDALSMI